jgi:hypothetical protein
MTTLSKLQSEVFAEFIKKQEQKWGCKIDADFKVELEQFLSDQIQKAYNEGKKEETKKLFTQIFDTLFVMTSVSNHLKKKNIEKAISVLKEVNEIYSTKLLSLNKLISKQGEHNE